MLVLSAEYFEDLYEQHNYVDVQSNRTQNIVVYFKCARPLVLAPNDQLRVVNKVHAEQKHAEYADDKVENPMFG